MSEMSIDRHNFTGHIYIFHSFDVGDDINLDYVKQHNLITRHQMIHSKYFKNYHIPLAVELPSQQQSIHAEIAKLHNFGVITLRYKIPFNSTLQQLRTDINDIDDAYHNQSVSDAGAIFKSVKSAIKQPRFFHLRKSYVLIQVNTQPDIFDAIKIKETYGNIIASTLRFETETLSEYQKNEILETALGYYRGDLIIIDTEAAFVYDDEYEEILDLFEFANMQHLELQYFDRVLDQKLNAVYEQEVKTLPIQAYLPFWGTIINDPVGELGKLRVDISVITERLENSIKLVGEQYYSELYSLLVQKLDLTNWKESINNKLSIIHDIGSVYQNKVDVMRQDVFSILIIILIFMEFIVGILHYFK
ncbi:MAG: hypothetical protein WC707_01900 [Candidatus Babeliaceae bacterium]